MSSILIVARTRVGDRHCCIGALDLENNRSLRLLNSKGFYFYNTARFRVGDVWEMDYVARESKKLIPPHNEDVIIEQVYGKSREVQNIQHLLLDRITPWSGGPSSLFDGALRATKSGSGYITRRYRVPDRSTGYWMSDRPLFHRMINDQNYFIYENNDNTRRLKHVGYQEIVDAIPSGTLLRISLAKWWCPDGNDEFEERCYLQLSGWY